MSKLLFFFLFSFILLAQDYPYEVSASYPFGRLNPAGPPQLQDFGHLTGEYRCKSTSRKSQQEWNETQEIIWRWKYIMNGLGIQDETLKPDGSHSGSIRVSDTDSLTWRVHYYTNSTTLPVLSAWTGGLQDNGDIVLTRNQVSPNDLEGFYRITFSAIREEGFEWLGEWVHKEETFVYPTWRISCLRSEE